jgi:hypothetical protein
VRWGTDASISFLGEHEAAGEDERGAEAGGGADAGVAQWKPPSSTLTTSG